MIMTNEEVSQKLYELIYQAFETGHFDAFRTSAGAHNQSNEIQFRLMKNISELRKNTDNNDEIVNAIMADVNLAQAVNWITNETYEKIEKLLGEL